MIRRIAACCHKKVGWHTPNRRVSGKQVPALVVLVLGSLPMLLGAGARAQTTTAPPAPFASAPRVVPIKDTNYPIPPGALFVAPHGSATNAGNRIEAPTTVAHALATAPAGATIVFRGGSYRDVADLPLDKTLTLQAYPHEQPWIKGSVVVGGWAPDGPTRWVRTGWIHGFHAVKGSESVCPPSNPTCYLDRNYPLADHRDMVFVTGTDGVPQPRTQVATLAQVKPGTFFVDYAADKLYVGDDPRGKTVEATAYSRPFARRVKHTGPYGVVIRGLGFTHYADGVEITFDQVTLENNTFAWNADFGVWLYIANTNLVRGNLFACNGQTGLFAIYSGNTIVERNTFRYNSVEGFSKGWSACAMKTGYNTNTHVRDNVVEYNYGNGIWMDTDEVSNKVYRNTVRFNAAFGIFMELSHGCVVASNVCYDNAWAGIALSDSSSTRVFNNTLSHNNRSVVIFDTDRVQPSAPKAASGVTWTTRNNVLKNNIYTRSRGTRAVFFASDNLGASSAAAVAASDYNAYHRLSIEASPFVIRWSSASGSIRDYATIAAFRAAAGNAGYEAHALAIDDPADPFFVDQAKEDFRLKPGSPAINRGEPLPGDIASLIGVAPGVPVDLGALHLRAAATTPPPPPSNLVAVAGPGRIDLSWADHSNNENGFKIERSRDGAVWLLIDAVGRNVTRYADTGLSADITYHYRVRAYNAGGDSEASNTATATTPSAPDLRVTDLSWLPAQPRTGDRVTFRATITNQGTHATPPGVPVSVAFFVGGTKVAWGSTGALAVGESRGVAATGGLNNAPTWTAPVGHHRVGAFVDPDDRIVEKSEANNRLEMPLITNAVVVPATADAFVRGGDHAAKNYGTQTRLELKQDPWNASFARESFLKFDTGPLSGTIEVAKLRVYGGLSRAGAPRSVTVYPVASTGWGETDVTWNTKPTMGSGALGSVTVTSTEGWYEIDITGYVNAQKSAGASVIGLGLKTNSGDLSVSFHSKEGGSNGPQLAIGCKTPGQIPVPNSLQVSLTSPTNGARFTAPATVVLAASVRTGAGRVVKVEFFQGATKLGEDTTAPYNHTWVGVAPGSYTVSAKVWDDRGASAPSTPVAITVAAANPANRPPTVRLTGPADGARFVAPAAITLEASADDPDGNVVKVEFYQGSAKLGEDTSAPYSHHWTNVAPGNYTVTAKVTDDDGANASATPVAITVSGATPGPGPVPAPALVNLALNKIATQSSTPPGVTSGANRAALAIDNNTDGAWGRGSVTHTGLDKQAWWQVDLGARRAVATIELFNRTDAQPQRLSNFHVLLSDTPFPSSDLHATLAQPGVWHFTSGAIAGSPTRISVHRMGRYVRVQLMGTNFLSLAEVKVLGYADALPNLALGKTATQSSRPQGTPAPGAAVDGNTNGNWSGGSVTHTHLEKQPWWQVDLGASRAITTLNLFNRTDNSQERLRRVHVFVSAQPFTSTDLTTTLKQPGVWHGYIAATVGIPTSVPVHRSGRYVRVQLSDTNYLSLAEMEVLGFPDSNPNVNLALNKTASQSSRPAGIPAPSAAVDGNVDGRWSSGSITHTHLEARPWWQVDLGASHSVTHVELFNRTDNVTERLANLYVLVSDTPFASTNLQATLAQPGVAATHLSAQVGTPTSLAVHRTGRYVRIQLAETNYLSLAEVKVMGLPVAGPSGTTSAATAHTTTENLAGPNAHSTPRLGDATPPNQADAPRPQAERPLVTAVAAVGPDQTAPSVTRTPAQDRGTGLLGQYFDNQNGTDLKTVRIDPTINFNWKRSIPQGTAITHPDTWSVRWSGSIEAPVTGTYTFTTTSDDGIRLQVGGKLLVNDEHLHEATDHQGTLFLRAGQRYPIRIEYFEAQMSATAKLWWSHPGQAKQIIPTERLYPSQNGRR